MQLIECVPNFSEGRNLRTIEKIADVIAGVNGVYLLDVDSNASANRTVMTFVGEPELVCEAAFRAMSMAQSLIDMSIQHGEHPRIGATDVCPLVPLSGIDMGACVEWSNRLAARVAAALQMPVYLYAMSARNPQRRRLAFLRKGQYEGLKQRMTAGNFAPDYGPHVFNARCGATAIGARELLIAFNVNLALSVRGVAEQIAVQIRRAREDYDRALLAEGEPAGPNTPLLDCTAIGWYIEEYKRAQVSMNIMDFRKTSIYKAFEEVKRLAAQYGTDVTGSEVVGLVPLQALLETGRYALSARQKKDASDAEHLIESAVEFLNLRDTRPFDAQKKILDYRLQNLPPLRNMAPSN